VAGTQPSSDPATSLVTDDLDGHHFRRADEGTTGSFDGDHFEPVAELRRATADEALHPGFDVLDAEHVARLAVAEGDGELHGRGRLPGLHRRERTRRPSAG
jgi:hypothetical protein